MVFQQPDIVNNVIKVGAGFFLSIVVASLLAPILTHYLYKYRAWKKTSGKGKDTPIFNKLHKEKDTKTPRMGGLLLWVTTLIVALLAWLLGAVTDLPLLDRLGFVDRGQTWLPLFALVVASVIGLVDDVITIKTSRGVRFRDRLFWVTAIGAIGAWWFYSRLGVDHLHIPGFGDLTIGWLIIPVFILATMAMFSTSVIDGLDGLSGGVFATIFLAYLGIAFAQNQINIATLCAVIVGALFVFLWFNIPPARFYMTETGILGLTVTITVIAFLTDAVAVLPIIALVPIADAASSFIQLVSKKLRGGKKIFLVAPLHHHFEAKGWPAVEKP